MESSRKLEIRRLEIKRELKLREFEATEKELEVQKYEKELKHEREMRALELNACRITHKESIAAKFDLGKNVRLVPPFELEVDKYFQHFERVAQI